MALLGAFGDDERRYRLQAGGGDDYELCVTVPVAERTRLASLAEGVGTKLTRVGRVVVGDGVRVLGVDRLPWVPQRTGYAHFGD
jgi:thiamine-monophosphate kinase